MGISATLVKELKRSVGLPPECKCLQNQEWLDIIPNALLKGGLEEAKKAHYRWKQRWSKK